MKKYRFFLPCFITLLLLFTGAFSVCAEEMWSEEYYRAYDETGTLTDDQQVKIDQMACDFISEYHYDLVAAVITSDSYTGSLEEYAENFYTGNGFGYGTDASGVMFVYDADTSEAVFVKFGTAQEEVLDVFLELIEEPVSGFYEKHQAFGVMYAFLAYMGDYEEGVFDENLGRTSTTQNTGTEAIGTETLETEALETGEIEAEISGSETAGSQNGDTEEENSLFRECIENSGIERVGDGNDSRPWWYPVNTKDYAFYNDPDIPRVVDTADIFTDEEEMQMAELIAEISEKSQQDIVIFTDISDYGLGHDVYAADFYDFNGYGYGDENEGMCLMICMDLTNRGWYACATGPDTRGLYTEYTANALDDVLYEYMAAGSYGEGVLDWIKNIGTLYQKGIPFAPDWFPDRTASITEEEAAAAPRIVDDTGVFTEEEIAELTSEASALSEKYGLDIVIYTAPDDYHIGTDIYSNLFYEKSGYGLGDDHSGLCLTLYSTGQIDFSAYGSAQKKLTEVNEDRIIRYTSPRAKKGAYYQAAKIWLKHIRHMERFGIVARPLLTWIFIALFAAALARNLSWLLLERAKKKMKTIKLAWNADDFISGTPILNRLNDIYLNTDISRRYRPHNSSSSGSSHSSSSRSSYSSSYKGSSGRSHSGSGRSF